MKPKAYYNGTYDGVLVEWSSSGMHIKDDHGEEIGFPFSGEKVLLDVVRGDFEQGDRVTLYVEFEDYTIVGVEQYDFNPRRLAARLDRIEKHLGLDPL